MPKEDINYQNTIIYKIVCNDLDITDCYVGHTTNFIKRKQQHKDACQNPNNKSFNFKMYLLIRDNGGWDNWSMIEVEKYKCNDRNEATARERYWYEQLKGTLNRAVPGRRRDEWLETNKQQLKDKKHDYYLLNIDKILTNKQLYREKNKELIKAKKREQHICVCGSTVSSGYKHEHVKTLKHKEYIESIQK